MRKGPREFRRFLDISMGSLSELSYAIKLATTLGYMHQDQATEIEILRDHASRLTWGLYRAIARAGKRDKSAEGNPGMGTGKPASRG
jgi:four helix bundle protein